MIILFDSSTALCKLEVIDGETHHQSEWQADRQLAQGLLAYIRDCLSDHGFQPNDISGVGVYRGPGSFTGLRIGLTVLNTLANAQKLPIVGATGDNWRVYALRRLQNGDNDQIVLPLYGSDAHITLPRK